MKKNSYKKSVELSHSQTDVTLICRSYVLNIAPTTDFRVRNGMGTYPLDPPPPHYPSAPIFVVTRIASCLVKCRVRVRVSIGRYVGLH